MPNTDKIRLTSAVLLKVQVLKVYCFQQKITDEVGMPPGKQKLQWESIFYKVNFGTEMCSRIIGFMLRNWSRIILIVLGFGSDSLNLHKS
jgi:hypothetical protein